MQKKVNVDTLVLEITRRCNANCAHCLRGNAQNCNINKKTIRQILSNINSINCITFTGGEPTLYVRAIRDTLNLCKELRIEVSYVYVVTNGLKYSKGLVKVMNDWLTYCMESMGYDPDSYRDLDYYLSDGLFGLSLSIDDFHPKMDYLSWNYKDLPYYNSCKEHNKKDSYIGIIKEGRAADNSIFQSGRTLRDSELSFSFYEGFKDEETVEMVYCNVNGDIFPCCDMSFTRQDSIAQEENINIFNNTLYDILYNNDIEYTKKKIA